MEKCIKFVRLVVETVAEQPERREPEGWLWGEQEEAAMELRGAYIMSFPSTAPTSRSPQTSHSTITYAFVSLENEVNQGQNNGSELECVQKNPSQLNGVRLEHGDDSSSR